LAQSNGHVQGCLIEIHGTIACATAEKRLIFRSEALDVVYAAMLVSKISGIVNVSADYTIGLRRFMLTIGPHGRVPLQDSGFGARMPALSCVNRSRYSLHAAASLLRPKC
jgi:hypothetical protein